MRPELGRVGVHLPHIQLSRALAAENAHVQPLRFLWKTSPQITRKPVWGRNVCFLLASLRTSMLSMQGSSSIKIKEAGGSHRITESQNGRVWKGPLWVI